MSYEKGEKIFHKLNLDGVWKKKKTHLTSSTNFPLHSENTERNHKGVLITSRTALPGFSNEQILPEGLFVPPEEKQLKHAIWVKTFK